MNRIMVVEDNKKFRISLGLDLEEAGYHCTLLDSAEAAFELLRGESGYWPDLLLLDVRMEGMSGIELLGELNHAQILPPTLVMSGEASITETVTALGYGVHDVLEKPFTCQRLLQSIKNCLGYYELQRQVQRLRDASPGSHPILGESAVIRQLRSKLLKIAPTSGRVLILGESGTGKELVANFLHHHSQRAKGPFVKINCAALPSSMIEDELFGHVRGAFTGAVSDKPGLFEDAHGGTLLLDEIGDMDLGLQTRLLRVLEDGVVRRVGGRREIKVDVRVIAATNKDPKELVDEGQFREDLYFRLNTLPVTVPALRERGGDIDLLARFFVGHFCKVNQFRLKTFSNQALELLKAYAWPGNVRELRNLCERLAILGGEPIQPDDFPSDIRTNQASGGETGLVRIAPLGRSLSLKAFKTQCEKEFIENALKRFNWDYVKTSKFLQIQRTYLHRKISQLAIEKPGKGERAPMETVS